MELISSVWFPLGVLSAGIMAIFEKEVRSMDGGWQTDGMGYYVHFHIIEELELEDRYDYQVALIEDSSV